MAQESDDMGVDATTGATRQVARTEEKSELLSRLHIGGYGEAVMSRNFYEENLAVYFDGYQ